MKTPLALCSDLAEFLFPTGCCVCGAPLIGTDTPFSPVCNTCTEEILAGRIHARRCPVCGTVLTSEEGACLRCRERTYDFDSHRAPFMYAGGIKTLMAAYKTGGLRSVSRFFARILGDCLAESYPGIPVVPVPARPAALRARGFDNTGLICRHLQCRSGVRVLHLLKRSNARQQKSLDYNERFINVESTFSIKKDPPPETGHVILFDDVFTTGATAHACARVLKSAGLQRVDVFTIAQD